MTCQKCTRHLNIFLNWNYASGINRSQQFVTRRVSYASCIAKLASLKGKGSFMIDSLYLIRRCVFLHSQCLTLSWRNSIYLNYEHLQNMNSIDQDSDFFFF